MKLAREIAVFVLTTLSLIAVFVLVAWGCTASEKARLQRSAVICTVSVTPAQMPALLSCVRTQGADESACYAVNGITAAVAELTCILQHYLEDGSYQNMLRNGDKNGRS